MKKVLITALAVMASLSLYAQGTIVFNNDATSQIWADSDGLLGPNAAVKAGATYTVGFYWGTPGTPEGQLKLAGTTITGTPSAGNIKAVTLSLAGTAGGDVVDFQVRGWSTAAGATYEDAVATGNTAYLAGVSSVVKNFATGGAGTPAGPANPIKGLFGTVTMVPIVPEPSTFALGILGLAGLFVLRRRN